MYIHPSRGTDPPIARECLLEPPPKPPPKPPRLDQLVEFIFAVICDKICLIGLTPEVFT